MPAARRNTQQFYVWKSNPTKCTKGWEQKKKWKDPCTTYFTHLRSLCRVHTRGGRACRRYLVRLWSVEFSSNTKEISVISQLRVRTNPKDLHSVPSNFGIWYFFFYFFYSLFFFFYGWSPMQLGRVMMYDEIRSRHIALWMRCSRLLHSPRLVVSRVERAPPGQLDERVNRVLRSHGMNCRNTYTTNDPWITIWHLCHPPLTDYVTAHKPLDKLTMLESISHATGLGCGIIVEGFESAIWEYKCYQ